LNQKVGKVVKNGIKKVGKMDKIQKYGLEK
jgi:hypothetical protein